MISNAHCSILICFRLILCRTDVRFAVWYFSIDPSLQIVFDPRDYDPILTGRLVAAVKYETLACHDLR